MMTLTSPASLFVYYLVPQAQKTATVEAVAQMQAELVTDWPGLKTRLMRRADMPSTEASAGTAIEETWMETYDHPSGVSEHIVQAIAARAKALPTGLMGVRYVEIFVPLNAPKA